MHLSAEFLSIATGKEFAMALIWRIREIEYSLQNSWVQLNKSQLEHKAQFDFTETGIHHFRPSSLPLTSKSCFCCLKAASQEPAYQEVEVRWVPLAIGLIYSCLQSLISAHSWALGVTQWLAQVPHNWGVLLSIPDAINYVFLKICLMSTNSVY